MIANVLSDIDFIQQVNKQEKINIISYIFRHNIVDLSKKVTADQLSNVHQMHISESHGGRPGLFTYF